MNLHIAILEDHPIYAAGLRELIEQLLPSTEIYCTNSLVNLVETLGQNPAHMVLADLHVLDGKGIEMLETIKATCPQAIVLGLTGDETLLAHNRCNPMSEFRILSKVESFEHIMSEVRNLLKRSSYLDKNLSAELMNIQQVRRQEGELTRKQLLVLNLMKQGLSNKEIARRLNVSPETVKTHAKDVYGRLGIKNRTQAATVAKRFGYMYVFSEA